MDKITNIDDYIEEKKEQVKSYKIGRNEPCPCGSGKKYKKCCAQVTPEKSKEYYREKIKEEKDADKVFEILLEADQDYPVDPDFTLPIAVYYLQNQDSENAKKYLQKAWRIMKEDLEDVFIMPLVNLLLQNAEVEKAASIVDRAREEKGDSPQLLIAQGEVMKAKGNFEGTFDVIEKGLEIESNNLELIIFKIETLLDVSNLVAALEVWYNRFDKLMPLVETDEVYALRFLKQLLIENFSMAEDAGKEEMKAVLEQAIEANHLWNEAYEKISDQEKDKAVEKLDKIRELLPSDSALITNLLHDYNVAGNNDRVIETAKKSEKYFSDNPDFNHMIGLALMGKGKLNEAKPKLDTAHEMAHGPNYETQADKWSITGDYIRYFLETGDSEGLLELIEDIDSLIDDKDSLISTLIKCLEGYPLEEYPVKLLITLKEKQEHPLIDVKELYIVHLDILLKMLQKAEKQAPEAVNDMKEYLEQQLKDLDIEKIASPLIELAFLRIKEDEFNDKEIEEKYNKLIKQETEFPEEVVAKYEAIIRYGNPELLLDNPPEEDKISQEYLNFYKLTAAIKTKRIDEAEELFKQVGYSEIRKGNSSGLFLQLLNYLESEKLIKVLEEFDAGSQFINIVKEIDSYLKNN